MADEVTKKQDGGAIFAALTDFEGMPEREQPEQQERDFSSWEELTSREQELAQAYAEAAEEMRNDPLFDLDTAHGLEQSGRGIGDEDVGISARPQNAAAASMN